MSFRKFRKFESLENRLCLSVSVAVTDGDLVVEGDADGAVEIVAVSEGAYRVTDNGVLIADETTLTGVTDDIHINLEDTVTGTNDTVTVDLAGQTVDKVYADLGDGDNSFELTGGTASGLNYHGGDGIDSVSLAGTIENRAVVSLRDGDNELTISGAIGNLAIHGGDGNDTVTLADTAAIADSFFARLGEGENTVTNAGTVEGDFSVVSFNEDDVVDITDTAVIGGETNLGLGEQEEFGGGCHGGIGIGLGVARGLEPLALNGRNLGFYYRGFRR